MGEGRGLGPFRGLPLGCRRSPRRAFLGHGEESGEKVLSLSRLSFEDTGRREGTWSPEPPPGLHGISRGLDLLTPWSASE